MTDLFDKRSAKEKLLDWLKSRTTIGQREDTPEEFKHLSIKKKELNGSAIQEIQNLTNNIAKTWVPRKAR